MYSMIELQQIVKSYDITAIFPWNSIDFWGANKKEFAKPLNIFSNLYLDI